MLRFRFERLKALDIIPLKRGKVFKERRKGKVFVRRKFFIKTYSGYHKFCRLSS